MTGSAAPTLEADPDWSVSKTASKHSVDAYRSSAATAKARRSPPNFPACWASATRRIDDLGLPGIRGAERPAAEDGDCPGYHWRSARTTSSPPVVTLVT
jgi:hypothetical protein